MNITAAAARLMLASALFAPAPAFAGAGVAGANILKVPTDARGWGIGMAYSAIADDAGAMAYNPAGLSQLSDKEFRFIYQTIIESVNRQALMFAYPFGRWGTGGVSWVYQGSPTIQNSGDEYHPFEGLPQGVDVTESCLGFYYGTRFSHLLPAVRIMAPFSVGLGLKRVAMQIDRFGASTVALDAGILLSTDILRGALVLQNVGGGYAFPGTIEAESDPLPQTLRLALAVVPYEDASGSLTIAIENAQYVGVATSQKYADEGVRTARESMGLFCAGMEYWRLKRMGVRIGYVSPYGNPVAGGSQSWATIRGLAMGGTFHIYAGALAYEFDLAYHPMNFGTLREDAFSLSLGIRF
jgi:hypothetical protein